jgi:hypothetical protein
MGDRNSVKRDKNEINADPATVLAITLAALLIPLLLVGLFSH